MKEKKKYCNFCAGELEERQVEGMLRQVCPACGHIYYENPLPVVSVIIANEKGELLLVKRAMEPAKDTWCFPIGFLECGESVEDAALRELKEEAGIEGRIVRLFDVSSDATGTYGEVVVTTYLAEKVGGTEAAGDDACDIGYFAPERLPELAFPSQRRAAALYLSGAARRSGH